jgi:hypothetical protein
LIGIGLNWTDVHPKETDINLSVFN